MRKYYLWQGSAEKVRPARFARLNLTALDQVNLEAALSPSFRLQNFLSLALRTKNQLAEHQANVAQYIFQKAVFLLPVFLQTCLFMRKVSLVQVV